MKPILLLYFCCLLFFFFFPSMKKVADGSFLRHAKTILPLHLCLQSGSAMGNFLLKKPTHIFFIPSTKK